MKYQDSFVSAHVSSECTSPKIPIMNCTSLALIGFSESDLERFFDAIESCSSSVGYRAVEIFISPSCEHIGCSLGLEEALVLIKIRDDLNALECESIIFQIQKMHRLHALTVIPVLSIRSDFNDFLMRLSDVCPVYLNILSFPEGYAAVFSAFLSFKQLSGQFGLSLSPFSRDNPIEGRALNHDYHDFSKYVFEANLSE